MLKWIVLLLGGGVLFIIAIFCFLAFMVWNHERGFPKSILAETLKNTCVVNKRPFVLVKSSRGYIGEKVFDFLPKPEGLDYVYNDYLPGTISNEDGTEIYDLSNAIEIAAGTHFILKDGFQNRNLNGSEFYFWLEPEGIKLDSNYYHSPYPISLEPAKEGGIQFYSAEELAQFPETLLFKKTCDEE